MSKINLVIFDVGGVLIQLNPWSEAFSSLFDGTQTSFSESRIEEFIRSEPFDNFEKGLIGGHPFCNFVREFFQITIDDPSIENHYRAILGPPVEGMPQLMKSLIKNDFRICGLSDTSPFHLNALFDYEAVSQLERLITSCETSLKKPSTEAYAKALNLLNAEAKKTVFIDDRQANVEGARNAGLHAFQFEGIEKLKADLSQLLEIELG